MLLVTTVATVVLVIAPHGLLDAAMGGIAPELVQPTMWARLVRAVLLVRFVATVQITVAPLFLGQAKLPVGWCVSAPKVIGLAFSIVCKVKVRLL